VVVKAAAGAMVGAVGDLVVADCSPRVAWEVMEAEGCRVEGAPGGVAEGLGATGAVVGGGGEVARGGDQRWGCKGWRGAESQRRSGRQGWRGRRWRRRRK
jgi:hypothetical protein